MSIQVFGKAAVNRNGIWKTVKWSWDYKVANIKP